MTERKGSRTLGRMTPERAREIARQIENGWAWITLSDDLRSALDALAPDSHDYTIIHTTLGGTLMMTARNFDAIAKALRETHASAATVRAVADVCRASTPGFNYTRFLAAATETGEAAA